MNSGPPPDPNSGRSLSGRNARERDRDGWTLLPSEGRSGRAPGCPLRKPTARERQLWAELWRTPQAAAWERLGWTREVALYVRLFMDAEMGDVKAAAEVRQWSDRLGLNPAAMLRHRWRVAADELAEKRPTVAVAEEPATRRPRRLRG